LVTSWWHFKPLPTLDHHPARWWSWYDIRCLVGGQATMGSRTGAHLEPRLQGVLAGSRLLSEKCLIKKRKHVRNIWINNDKQHQITIMIDRSPAEGHFKGSYPICYYTTLIPLRSLYTI
jgi:hypothetical protein